MIRQLVVATAPLFLALGFAFGPANVQQDRDTKVRNDRTEVADTGLWIYNDLPQGIAEARKTGKPLLVIFRCVP